MRITDRKTINSTALISGCLLMIFSYLPGAARADEYRHLIQYELSFGSRHPVTNLYLSMQEGGTSNARQLVTDDAPVLKSALFSTDPHKLTMLNPLPWLHADAEAGVGNGEDGAGSGFGQALAGLAGVILVFGPVAYGVVQEANKFGDEICKNLEDCGISLPEMPPNLNPPTPNQGS